MEYGGIYINVQYIFLTKIWFANAFWYTKLIIN